YMAPEQAAGQVRETGPASDVYSLGAILYEQLTGQPPFKAATVMETLRQVVAEGPVPPHVLQSALPRDLDAICMKCLQKDPQRRYATAEELAEDLRRFRAGQPVLARHVGALEKSVRCLMRRPAALWFWLVLLAL